MQDFIPNPLDEKSNLELYGKKLALLNSKLNFEYIIFFIGAGTTLLLALICLLLSESLTFNFLKLAKYLFFISVINTFGGFMSRYFRKLAIKAYSDIDIIVPSDYRKVVITSAYLNMLRSVSKYTLGFAFAIIGFFVFRKEIQEYFSLTIQSLNNSPLDSTKITIFFVGICILPLFIMASSIFKYNMLKKMSAQSDYAKVSIKQSLVETQLRLIFYFPIIALIIIIASFRIVPLYIPLGIIGLLTLFFLLTLLQVKQLKNFNEKKFCVNPIGKNIQPIPNEQIVACVYGITRMDANIGQFFRQAKYQLKTMKKLFSENTLIITDSRLLFLEIPVTLDENMNASFTYQSFIFNREKIQREAEKLLSLNSLDQMLKYTKNELQYSDIQGLNFKQFQIIFTRNNGEKLKYGYMDAKYTDILKKYLKSYIGSKFVFD